jgi:hypothetical protein
VQNAELRIHEARKGGREPYDPGVHLSGSPGDVDRRQHEPESRTLGGIQNPDRAGASPEESSVCVGDGAEPGDAARIGGLHHEAVARPPHLPCDCFGCVTSEDPGPDGNAPVASAVDQFPEPELPSKVDGVLVRGCQRNGGSRPIHHPGDREPGPERPRDLQGARQCPAASGDLALDIEDAWEAMHGSVRPWVVSVHSTPRIATGPIIEQVYISLLIYSFSLCTITRVRTGRRRSIGAGPSTAPRVRPAPIP